MVSLSRVARCLSVLLISSCNVPEPPPSTGGATFADGGANFTDSDANLVDVPGEVSTPRTCDRGVLVVASDFKSTNVVVSGLDGVTLSGSFVSSAAAKPGLTLALSGDVDVPYVAPRSRRAVILDRYGTNVITWLNVDTAEPIGQLPIGQGFESNPHDYIEVDDTRAFVSRYGANLRPGAQPFDEGGDLLILDLRSRSIAGRIAMPEDDPRLLPCPAEMNWLGREVVVTLARWSRDFAAVGEGRFVGVSPETETVAWRVDVPGLDACGRVAVSPDGHYAAIACSGRYDFDTKRYDTSRSDIVLFDATQRPPTELRRFRVAVQLDSSIQPTLVFASARALLGTAYGGNATVGDQAFALDIESGALTALVTSAKPFVLGGIRCSPGCGDICLLCDAAANRLRRWKATASGFEELSSVVLESIVGLPPRTIGGI